MNDQPSVEQQAQAELDRFIQRVALEHGRAQVLPVGGKRDWWILLVALAAIDALVIAVIIFATSRGS